MSTLVADFDPLAARADEVFECGVQIQRGAHLVEIGDLHIAALAHAAAVGRQFAQHQLKQRGFARAIGADQPDFVATQDGGRKVADHQALVKCFAHIFQLGHDFAAGGTAVHIHAHAPQGFAPLLALLAQGLQAANACDRPGAAGFHAFADPGFFLSQQFVGTGVDNGFLLQLLLFQLLILLKIAGVTAQLAAIQFNNAGADGVQKRPVVANDNHGAGKIQQQILQPDNGIHIQVVGWLVQQQHMGAHDERLRQGHAFDIAARQRADARLPVQPELVQGSVHTLFPLPAIVCLDLRLQGIQIALPAFVLRNQIQHGRQPLLHGFKHRGMAIERGFLRHIGRDQPLLPLHHAVVWLLQPRQNFEQRRFARAIAPDQPDPLAFHQ